MLSRSAGAPAEGFDAIEFSGPGPAVVAVSGGSDSLALLFLLMAHLERTGQAKPVIAVTVDHGLRTESAREAAWTGALCRDHGIAHETLAWTGPKPDTGIQAAARTARYDLLSRFARRAGADFVLIGHTLDDQRETVLMRSWRGEGSGLAGIAPATFARADGEGVWFLRPLLGTRRTSLREYLSGTGIKWIDDPSNLRADFERVRARNMLKILAPDDPMPVRLDAMRHDAALRRLALGRRAARLLETHVREVMPGLFLLPDALLGDADREAVTHVLRIAIAFAGGSAHPPPLDRARALAERAAAEKRFRTTIARVLVDRRDAGAWLLREARDIGPGKDDGTFDNRFAPGADLRLPDPAEVARRAAGLAGTGAPASLVRAALARQPVTPAGMAPRRLLHPWARLVPLIDLEPANAIAFIAGAGKVAPPPYKGPIERLIQT